MSEPTSALTFRDLILEVARKLGYANYGEDGDGPIEIPSDPHDLDECKRIVNKAIRMFVADAPASGWKWARPVAEVTLWGTVATDSDNLATSGGYDPVADRTTLNVSEDSFYPSMEERTLTLTGVGDFVIASYVSATQIKVRGDATGAGAAGVTWSITSDGNFTLPSDFGGEYSGDVTYAAGTEQGVGLDWTSDAIIRQWRADLADDSGDPFLAAVRPMATGQPRRRWELMVYPQPDDVVTVTFPYTVGFDQLVELDEVPPMPFSHDETVRAACLAMAEKDNEDMPGPDWEYYRSVALPNSYRSDLHAAPKKLGYFGRGGRGRPSITTFRNHMYQRPNVTLE
jgi:hypothetical protein